VVLCLVFLVLTGNNFWCFGHMVLIVQYNCAVESVFGSSGKLVLVLHTYVLRVQYNCGVVLVFWSWREIVIDFTYVFSVQYSCGVVNITEKNYDRKKGTVVWPCWITCQNTNTNYDQKKLRPEKRYSRLAYTICNTRNILFLLCLYLKGGNQLT
jgi:hypothetical protein